MPDPIDRPEPPTRRATKASRRRPRFVLPPDEAEDQTTERIEAFLEGPARPIRHRPLHLRSEPLRRPRQLVPIDTRTDWESALRHEDHRFARYGRPVAILIVEVRSNDHDAVDRLARRVGTIVRDLARATDRVTRVSPTRYQVLLPETDEAAATTFGSRVRRACRTEATERAGERRWDVVAVAAAPLHGATLVDALRTAQARLTD